MSKENFGRGGWNPTENYIIRFDDKTGEERTEEQLMQMVRRIQEVANEYDFDLLNWGGQDGMYIVLNGEYRLREQFKE